MLFLIGFLTIPAICGLLVIIDTMIEFIRYYSIVLQKFYVNKAMKKEKRRELVKDVEVGDVIIAPAKIEEEVDAKTNIKTGQ